MSAIYKKYRSKYYGVYIVRWDNEESKTGVTINGGSSSDKAGRIWNNAYKDSSTERHFENIETIEDWLHALPADCRAKALENRKNACGDFLNYKTTSDLYTALGRAFYWEKSPEGYQYWKDIRDQIYNNDIKGVEIAAEPAKALETQDVESEQNKKENMQKLPVKFYIKVSKPEFCQAIQAKLFEFGYKWAGDNQKILSHGGYMSFICVNNQEMTWLGDDGTNYLPEQEITMGELFMTPSPPPKIEQLIFKAGEFMDDYELRVAKDEVTVNDPEDGYRLYHFAKEKWKNYRENIHKKIQPDPSALILGKWHVRIEPKTISIGCQDIPYEKWVEVMAKIDNFQRD